MRQQVALDTLALLLLKGDNVGIACITVSEDDLFASNEYSQPCTMNIRSHAQVAQD